MAQSRRNWSSAGRSVLVGGLTMVLAVTLAPAEADDDGARGAVVDPVPAPGTPAVRNGSVNALAVVGRTVVIGGTFKRVANRGQKRGLKRHFLAAFDRKTGRVLKRFRPRLNGPVTSLERARGGSSVYVGGKFTRVNGSRALHVTQLRLKNGRRTERFRPPRIDGDVRAMAFRRGVLYVGGQFKRVGRSSHRGIVALSGRRGKVTRKIGFGVSGTLAGIHGRPKGRTGVIAMDISPNGKRLLIGGNFSKVGKHRRVQLAQIRLGRRARVMNWATRRYRARCSFKWDTYMRGLAYAPSGRFFVVATTGGSHRGALCDTVARFRSSGRSGRQQPMWVNATGGDTLMAADVSRHAVYVGGHQRWMNNPRAKDRARAGAVPRPGLAALDPRTGMPLRWNPGRHPRGIGVSVLEVTKQGLWVGSDTKWIGARKYRRPRIALFPTRPGLRLEGENQSSLPATVYQLGAKPRDGKRVTAVSFNGRRAKRAVPLDIDGLGRLSSIRAGFVIGGDLVYATRNGGLFRRAFERTRVGERRALNPYNDPEWSHVPTDVGETYRGRDSGLRADLRRSTGMFYNAGRLYYTLRGKRHLYWRPFSVDSGASYPRRRQARSSVRWGKAVGMFRSGNHLYFARSSGGRLLRVRFVQGAVRGKTQALPRAQSNGVRWNNRVNVLYGNKLPE